MNKKLSFKESCSPENIVKELDKYIVGQSEAKKSVAISLRNRYRRMRIHQDMAGSVIPKNILMVGPTGIGKTEIARRLAALYEAPFIKVEATRFTEIGYVGKDVESIIRDLADVAVKIEKKSHEKSVLQIAKKRAEKKIISYLLKKRKEKSEELYQNNSYDLLKKKLDEGFFNDKEIEIELKNNQLGLEVMAPPGMEDITKQLQGFLGNISNNKKIKKKLKIKEALEAVKEEEMQSLLNEENIKHSAKKNIENYGIVFIDEIDKLTQSSILSNNKAEISREGVQRDLLPLIEGSIVKTKIGNIKTDNILFFASGAFHFSKPSDLLPELQGRLPIKIYLNALKTKDLMRILIEPKASIIKQHQALLETENINLKYEKSAIKRIAEISYEINLKTENLGARRLYSIVEFLLEDISFNAEQLKNKTIRITGKYVDKKLSSMIEKQDLDKFIL